MGAPIVHFEIGGRDSDKTAAFYRELFDWQIEQMGPAAMIATGSAAGIDGHVSAPGHEPHDYVTVYAEVDDIPACLARAEALGGKTIIPGQGHFAWFTDIDGNIIGLWNTRRP